MHSKEIRELINENSSLFWSIPDQEKENISPELLVETIFNYGDEKAVQKLFNLMVINFFNLYFQRHAQRNIDRQLV